VDDLPKLVTLSKISGMQFNRSCNIFIFHHVYDPFVVIVDGLVVIGSAVRHEPLVATFKPPASYI